MKIETLAVDCQKWFTDLKEKNKSPEQLLHEICNNCLVDWPILSTQLKSKSFLTLPASLGHHGNWKGGLFEHSLAVAFLLYIMTLQNNLSWEHIRSPLVIGLLHDVCKMEDYEQVETGTNEAEFVRSKQASYYPGHGVRSALLLADMGISLTKEERLCIVHHMGAYETDCWKEYSAAIKECPNVLYAHQADMIASQVEEV